MQPATGNGLTFYLSEKNASTSRIITERNPGIAVYKLTLPTPSSMHHVNTSVYTSFKNVYTNLACVDQSFSFVAGHPPDTLSMVSKVGQDENDNRKCDICFAMAKTLKPLIC